MRTKAQDCDRKFREYWRNPEQARARLREYRRNNPDKARTWMLTNLERNKDAIRMRKKLYRIEHPEACALKDKKCRAKRLLTNPDLRREEYRRAKEKLRRQIIAAYGGKCQCCGEKFEEFMTIDHIGGRGCHERSENGIKLYRILRRLGFPKDKFRLLCMNCNFSYGMRGYCPHARESVIAI